LYFSSPPTKFAPLSLFSVALTNGTAGSNQYTYKSSAYRIGKHKHWHVGLFSHPISAGKQSLQPLCTNAAPRRKTDLDTRHGFIRDLSIWETSIPKSGDQHEQANRRPVVLYGKHDRSHERLMQAPRYPQARAGEMAGIETTTEQQLTFADTTAKAISCPPDSEAWLD
jgi:hypothetical protein